MATEISKVRIVRCPKCLRLLTEVPDIPVYTCGGCGTVLRAKNGRKKKEDDSSQMSGITSSEKIILHHTSGNGEPNTLNGEYSSFPKNEETSKHKENANTDKGLRDESMRSEEQPGVLMNETNPEASDLKGKNAQGNMDSCSNEQQDNCSKLGEPEFTNHCPCSKDDVGQGCLVSKHIADLDHGSSPSQGMGSPTERSCHAYDGNDLSDAISDHREECLLLSPVVRSEDSQNTEIKYDKENMLRGVVEDSKSNLKTRSHGSSSFDENITSLVNLQASDSDFISSLSSRFHYARVNSQHSEIFHSARKELKDDSSSTSLSRNSSLQSLPSKSANDNPTMLKNLENECMELLNKVDELRDHLTGHCIQGHERNQRSHIQGTRQYHSLHLFYGHGSEKVFQCSNSHFKTQNQPRFSGQCYTKQRFRSGQVPYSGHGYDSVLHCCPEDWCISQQMLCDCGCRACASHVCCYPSTSSSSCLKDCNTVLCSCKGQAGKHHYKEKNQPIKCHVRPFLGGAPFVICNNCIRLLRIPADFFVSKAQYHKLKCGYCSEVLIFLSHGGGHIMPHDRIEVDPAPSEVDQPCAYVQGDPVSYSEEYGPPFSRNYSMDGEPVPQNVIQSLQSVSRRRGKQAIGYPLHRLMGYDSATELIYQPSDIDEAYESGELAPVYGTSPEIQFSEDPQR